jgi:hypothetical protein
MEGLVHPGTAFLQISLVCPGYWLDSEKDRDILILRRQLDIVERKQKRAIKPDQAEKLILAVLTARLKQASAHSAGQSYDIICITVSGFRTFVP